MRRTRGEERGDRGARGRVVARRGSARGARDRGKKKASRGAARLEARATRVGRITFARRRGRADSAARDGAAARGGGAGKGSRVARAGAHLGA